MKKKLRILAFILALMLALSGCVDGLEAMYRWRQMVSFDDMAYARPDIPAIESLVDEVAQAAQEGDLNKTVECVNGVYDAYDAYYTNMYLADIFYCADLTDTYWDAEYQYCLDNSALVEAALDRMYRALAASSLREELEGEDYFGKDFFLNYDGESVYDEALLALLEEEARLEGEYYALSAQSLEVDYYSQEYFEEYGTKMQKLFVELVKVRREIASYFGFDSYNDYAYAFEHNREYTPQEAKAYLKTIPQVLYDSYCRVNSSDIWDVASGYCSERDSYNYLQEATDKMGGRAKAAFSLMDFKKLYDNSYNENKYDGSFEVFLSAYATPYISMKPYLDQQDKLTFAHEFGHFLADYVTMGTAAGIDVTEVHSQAMEYLSLCYTEDTQDLERWKLADTLCVYMEQAAYALFELEVYDLPEEELTVENVQKLYERIGLEFGFDSWAWDTRDYVVITHFYTDPHYVFSYVVSNDVAFQIYQLEKEEPGAGWQVYSRCLESQDAYLLDFVKNYDLESPFAPGRIAEVAQTLAKGLE